MPSTYAERVRALVSVLYRQARQFAPWTADRTIDRRSLYVPALQTTRGAAADLCLVMVYWLIREPETAFGKSPTEALAKLPEIRSILEVELEDQSSSGWIPDVLS